MKSGPDRGGSRLGDLVEAEVRARVDAGKGTPGDLLVLEAIRHNRIREEGREIARLKREGKWKK